MTYSSSKSVSFHIAAILILCHTVARNSADNKFVQSQDFRLGNSHIRFARLRCLEQYPAADTIHFSDTPDTHCFMQCFLYKLGLMNLNTRGLDSSKFLDIWDDTEDDADDGSCIRKFLFDEPLSGQCSDCYRKLIEFRQNCLALFEYTFSANPTWPLASSVSSKSVGQSASEFCDSADDDAVGINTEDSESQEETFISQYKKRLLCFFQNLHYVDAYGRVDETELLLSYREANADNEEARAAIKRCAHRANAKFQPEYADYLVYELHTCLKRSSPYYLQITQKSDETSRTY